MIPATAELTVFASARTARAAFMNMNQSPRRKDVLTIIVLGSFQLQKIKAFNVCKVVGHGRTWVLTTVPGIHVHLIRVYTNCSFWILMYPGVVKTQERIEWSDFCLYVPNFLIYRLSSS